MPIDYDQLITPQMKAAALLSDKVDALAALRWQHETGGLELPGGAVFSTTRESLSQLTAAVVSLANGYISGPLPWKFETGFAEVTGEQITALASAVARHVIACFEAENAVRLALDEDAGTDIHTAFASAYAAAMQE